MKKTFLAVGMGVASCMWAAHTDAPPGRYDYTAKVAAAGQAGAAATTKSSEPEEALALADRTYGRPFREVLKKGLRNRPSMSFQR